MKNNFFYIYNDFYGYMLSVAQITMKNDSS